MQLERSPFIDGHLRQVSKELIVMALKSEGLLVMFSLKELLFHAEEMHFSDYFTWGPSGLCGAGALFTWSISRGMNGDSSLNRAITVD